MDKIILIYTQMINNKIAEVSLELIGKAKEFSDQFGYLVYTVAAGNDLEIYRRNLHGYAIDKGYFFQTDKIYDICFLAQQFADLCRQIQPDIFLLGATKVGRSLAPCIAALLHTGLTADCTELNMGEKGDLIQIRPAFQETILASIVTKTRPQMATIRPGILQHPEKDSKISPEINTKKTERKSDFQIELLSFEDLMKPSAFNIKKKRLLVVLGNGVKRKEDVDIFEQWAIRMGGAIACSRKLVERGWFTIERQVGLSGNSVEADVMVTVGVSGSVQFQAGIKRVKEIIAINNDENAPIMQIADTGILLDLELLSDGLTRRLITS